MSGGWQWWASSPWDQWEQDDGGRDKTKAWVGDERTGSGAKVEDVNPGTSVHLLVQQLNRFL